MFVYVCWFWSILVELLTDFLKMKKLKKYRGTILSRMVRISARDLYPRPHSWRKLYPKNDPFFFKSVENIPCIPGI